MDVIASDAPGRHIIRILIEGDAAAGAFSKGSIFTTISLSISMTLAVSAKCHAEAKRLRDCVGEDLGL